MSFAELYKEHAYHDLIEEAEKQGFELGVRHAEERIIKLLDNELEQCTCEEPMQHFRKRLEMIGIKGKQK